MMAMVQEQRLEQQRQEMEEHARQIKLRQQQELEKAASLRLSRERQQAMVSGLKMENINYMCNISIIIRPHCSNSWMRPIASDGVAWSVCVSVC